MVNIKKTSVTLLLGLSTICMISLVAPKTFITPSQAMQMPQGVPININDFLAYVGQNQQGPDLFNTHAHGKFQLANIDGLFSTYGYQISTNNQQDFFSAIDSLKNSKGILGPQAGIIKRYLNFKLRGSMDPLSWTTTIAYMVNNYFRQPYTDTPFLDQTPGRDTLDCGGGNFINRPNHGLGHGMRQGMYALNIIDGLNTTTVKFSTNEGIQLQAWVKHKIAKDPNFIQKVQLVSSFQRTGRLSEKDGGPVYSGYMDRDMQFFMDDAFTNFTGPGKLFKDIEEVTTYARALRNMANPADMDEVYLAKIIIATHRLDLRRLTYNRQTGSFQEVVSQELFGPDSYKGGEKEFVDVLWGRAGELLRATGDRDRDSKDPFFNNNYWQRNPAVFCPLALAPKKMANVLVNAKEKTRYHFR